MRQESLKGCLTTYEHASVIDGLFSLYWDAGCILDKTPFNSVISILFPYLEIFMPRSAFDRKLSIVLLNCDVRYHNCNSRVFMFQQKCPTCNCLILMMMSSLKLQCLRCPSSRHLLQPVILVSNDIFVHRSCFWRFWASSPFMSRPHLKAHSFRVTGMAVDCSLQKCALYLCADFCIVLHSC